MMVKRTNGETQPLIFLDNSTLAEVISLPPGQCGRRLEALGLRPGKIIKKLYGMPFCGPVTLEIDGRQVAIGYGAASRIIVKALKQENTILE
ncbi:MAG: ferrous iron transport protein A [Tepidanaerobacter acetatoxydans]|uniref:FeoA family protein n=1 Tax=Tepidanaerobacter acetatoxydans TaxID=499229 RepID=UPI0026EC261B|nr:FeoA family protein [Tepidanaerobacter acetatoxydans]NLU11564.1 ferrous iron transport protein A [Tepidanaerobacter acetatoxydans]